jgi:predicted 3-demethylubiquinone-9 3-methyltransferase (glyoxalase superfamily)
MQQQVNIQKITTNLWFDRNAAEAVDFYMGIFKNARKGRATFYGKEGVEFHGMPEGTLLTREFELEGRTFVALNGGPQFTFSEAISFIINCNTQEEIDHYWDKLAEGGTIQMCGWLKDKFGVSWQVVPVAFTEMLLDPDPAKVHRVMQQMFKMKKLDIAPLQKAFDGVA